MQRAASNDHIPDRRTSKPDLLTQTSFASGQILPQQHFVVSGIACEEILVKRYCNVTADRKMYPRNYAVVVRESLWLSREFVYLRSL